jgi:hypothetical protein
VEDFGQIEAIVIAAAVITFIAIVFPRGRK